MFQLRLTMRNFEVMRATLIILLIITLVSCVEISNNEYLADIEELITEVDSLEVKHKSIQIRELRDIQKWSDSVDLKIRKLFKPVSFEVGKQIVAFAQLRGDLEPFMGADTLINNRLIDQKTQLIHLRSDIENGSGKRSQYKTFVSTEKSKVDSLSQVIFKRDSVRIMIIRTFKELEFSLDSNLNEIFLKE